MVFTRQNTRLDDNPESPTRNQQEKNIREVLTPSRKLFMQENNELFVQQVIQYSQDLEGGFLHYHLLNFE